MPEAQSISRKALTTFGMYRFRFVIEIHFPERILMAQLIVYQMLLVRHMADQGVGTEGNAHALAGKVISCDLLIQLQTHLWKEVGIVEDSVSAFPCVVSAF